MSTTQDPLLATPQPAELPAEEWEKLRTFPLRETDGEPLESWWHRAAIQLLIESVLAQFASRDDFFVGGNMFIYYSLRQARKWDYRGPDFFYVSGVNRQPMRRYWVVWEEEGCYPDVIIELLSPKTAKADRTTKKQLYERKFRTPEYFCYDPNSHLLEGWRLGNRGYEALTPNEHGWLWSEELGLWVGTWKGVYLTYDETWLRFYDRNGQLVPIPAEAEKQRAEAAVAELARLKDRLAELEQRGEG
jgi:Uma2 family endonuclease